MYSQVLSQRFIQFLFFISMRMLYLESSFAQIPDVSYNWYRAI